MTYTMTMRGSIIIYGSSLTGRQNKVLEIIEEEIGQKVNWNYLTNFPDVRLIDAIEDKKSIGISQIKEGIVFLQERPFSLKIKVLVVTRADLMTSEAQNAMLKTLEEPADYSLIMLLSKTESGLLPTVVSRCRKVKANQSLEKSKDVKQEWTLGFVLNLNTGERLDWAEEFSKEEKDTVIETLEQWVEEGRGLLEKGGDSSLATLLERILEILGDLENTNVSTRLALEHALLSFD